MGNNGSGYEMRDEGRTCSSRMATPPPLEKALAHT